MFINIHTHFEQSDGIFILNGKPKNDLSALYSFGIHPYEAMKIEFNEDIFKKEITQKNCLAIGECGLDKNITIPIETQISLFEQQIAISEKFELPLIVHCVKSWNETLVIKKELKPSQPWIYHGFRKSNLVESVLDSGCYISIGTAIIYDQKLQQTIQNIPLEKIFLETDDDTSHSIREVYEAVAKIKNISIDELSKQILENFSLVFKKVKH
jgi:TatD DNase family protein